MDEKQNLEYTMSKEFLRMLLFYQQATAACCVQGKEETVMNSNSKLSITSDNALRNYDAAEDMAELDRRNARAEHRAKTIKRSLIFGALLAGATVVYNYWEQIGQLFP